VLLCIVSLLHILLRPKWVRGFSREDVISFYYGSLLTKPKTENRRRWRRLATKSSLIIIGNLTAVKGKTEILFCFERMQQSHPQLDGFVARKEGRTRG
jgi:hypothetical protein